MNPYLMAFSIYALLITPVTLHASVRVGRQVRYRLRVQAAGLPCLFSDKIDRDVDVCGNGEFLPLDEKAWAQALNAP